MNLTKKLMVEPGRQVRLDEWDPDATPGFKSKEAAAAALEANVKKLSELQYRLFADSRRALLIVLQGMDAAGKDGTIRHVMGPLNPQSCRVTSFKAPSNEELAHDFLWRIHRAVPPKGEIGIFNRSHYEDVLIVRVHRLVDKSVWSRRYDQINDFEKMLSENDVQILKFFLHIDKGEQLKRLKARMDDPTKQWKITPVDFAERKRWKDYVAAYEDVLTRCSTRHAPWFVIPANHKWFRNLAVSQIIVESLQTVRMRFPPVQFDPATLKIR